MTLFSMISKLFYLCFCFITELFTSINIQLFKIVNILTAQDLLLYRLLPFRAMPTDLCSRCLLLPLMYCIKSLSLGRANACVYSNAFYLGKTHTYCRPPDSKKFEELSRETMKKYDTKSLFIFCYF